MLGEVQPVVGVTYSKLGKDIGTCSHTDSNHIFEPGKGKNSISGTFAARSLSVSHCGSYRPHLQSWLSQFKGQIKFDAEFASTRMSVSCQLLHHPVLKLNYLTYDGIKLCTVIIFSHS